MWGHATVVAFFVGWGKSQNAPTNLVAIGLQLQSSISCGQGFLFSHHTSDLTGWFPNTYRGDNGKNYPPSYRLDATLFIPIGACYCLEFT